MEDNGAFTPRKLLIIIVEVILVAILVMTAIGLMQLYWVAPIGIVGASMEDTVYNGNTVYINKAYKSIERGDVVVTYIPEGYRNYDVDWWKYTDDNDDTQSCPASRTKTFDDFVSCLPFVGKANTYDAQSGQRVTVNGYYLVIKRVVGCPGDTVQIINGILHVNGAREDRAGLCKYKNDYSHVLQAGVLYFGGQSLQQYRLAHIRAHSGQLDIRKSVCRTGGRQMENATVKCANNHEKTR